jgi:hypothetical protein
VYGVACMILAAPSSSISIKFQSNYITEMMCGACVGGVPIESLCPRYLESICIF